MAKQQTNKQLTACVALKAMQHRQDVMQIKVLCTAIVEFITISIVIIGSIWPTSAVDCHVLKNFHRKFANLAAPPTD